MERKTKLAGVAIRKEMHSVEFEAELGHLVLGDVLSFRTGTNDSSITIVERYWRLEKSPKRSIFGSGKGKSSNQPLVLKWQDDRLKKKLEIYIAAGVGPERWEHLQDITHADGRCVVADSGRVRLKVMANYADVKDTPPVDGYDSVHRNGEGSYQLPRAADFLLNIERQA
jgi:hypothetical protein